MDRSSYVILGILRKCNAVHPVRGLTVNEIAEREKISKPNTIYKKIKALQKAGYLNEGVKAGKAKSYYIASEGIEILPQKKEENHG